MGKRYLDKYHELFKNTGVKLVLSEHNHNYQRLEKDGITYVVSGLGGQSKYKISNPEIKCLLMYTDF